MSVTASKLRENVYRILDEVLATGVPVDIVRNGRTLRIAAVDEPTRVGRLVRRPEAINGDPDDLVHLDWSAEWRA
ncbi:MAG: type II toxin-antitoxin system Phd/YefM family antitoxin [Ilumatobacteraceae bacterium]